MCAYIRSERMQGRSCPSVQRLHFRNIFTGFKLSLVLICTKNYLYELTCVQTGSGTHLASYPMGTGERVDFPKADGA
jgi:hypothetical protein